MVFSSLFFICVFLPIVYILYCVIPSLKGRNVLLIVVSLLFYAYGEPVYVLLLVASSFFNYIFARLIDTGHRKKSFLILSVILNIGILGVFKYTGFVIGTVNRLWGNDIAIPNIIMPIGISFFTFQALSYVVDVYRGTIHAQKNYFKVLLYISFFPQLIAGPIVKYRDICMEIDDRKFDLQEAASGLQRFIIGLSKKVLIANTMGITADHIFSANYSCLNILTTWIGAFAYFLQIYYDFSGYSDMSIGLGRMFGFHFKENFLYPYGAVSIQDFWHKWHISLSGWFREYLYIPLGGNRKGKMRTCVNKMIVFFCTGLWHGANWTFVIWGLFHGAFLLLEDFVPAWKRLPKVLSHIYVLLVVCVGFVLFRADTLAQGIYFIRQMFAGFVMTNACSSLAVQQMTPWFLVMLIAGIFGMAPLKRFFQYECGIRESGMVWKQSMMRGVGRVACIILLIWCMIHLSTGTYNPFIYFRF